MLNQTAESKEIDNEYDFVPKKTDEIKDFSLGTGERLILKCVKMWSKDVLVSNYYYFYTYLYCLYREMYMSVNMQFLDIIFLVTLTWPWPSVTLTFSDLLWQLCHLYLFHVQFSVLLNSLLYIYNGVEHQFYYIHITMAFYTFNLSLY